MPQTHKCNFKHVNEAASEWHGGLERMPLAAGSLVTDGHGCSMPLTDGLGAQDRLCWLVLCIAEVCAQNNRFGRTHSMVTRAKVKESRH